MSRSTATACSAAAYALAGELCAADGDHRAAFAPDGQRLRRDAAAGQQQAAEGVRHHVPPTQRAIDQRNRFFQGRPVAATHADRSTRS